MKILFVNRQMGSFWGGGESFDYNVALMLKKKGHNVSILTGKPLFSKNINYIKGLDEVIYLKTPYLRKISYLFTNKIPKLPTFFLYLDKIIFEKKAFQWIKKNKDKFDVINILNLPYLTKKIVTDLNKPVVVEFTGPPSEKFELNIYRMLNREKLRFFAYGDTFHYLRKKNFLVNEIYPGIDVDVFKKVDTQIRIKYFISSDDILLISVGRLIKNKGFEFLIETFKKLSEKYKNIKLMIVGDGFLKNELEKKIKKLNLEKKIFLVGQVENKELPKYYSASDIFLLLSRYESFSIVTLEAISCGLPVIVTNVGYLGNLVKETNGGFIVEYGNFNDLIQKISYLIDNPNIRKKISNLARQKILVKYNLEKTVLKIESLYYEII